MVKDSGISIRMCWSQASERTDPGTGRSLCRQPVRRRTPTPPLGVQPRRLADLALVVNGLPVATAELKNPLTHQNIEHAMAQYRTDRNPHDLIFAKRTLVHFAVDPNRVAMTTRLAGDHTRFLPFNVGSAGPGKPGAAGNPPRDGYQTAYLWEEVWQRDAWLTCCTIRPHGQPFRAVPPVPSMARGPFDRRGNQTRWSWD